MQESVELAIPGKVNLSKLTRTVLGHPLNEMLYTQISFLRYGLGDFGVFKYTVVGLLLSAGCLTVRGGFPLHVRSLQLFEQSLCLKHLYPL